MSGYRIQFEVTYKGKKGIGQHIGGLATRGKQNCEYLLIEFYDGERLIRTQEEKKEVTFKAL